MAGAPPSYCFVAFPPRAKDGLVVFGKNSARPRDEVQEVVYYSAADHEPESKVEVGHALARFLHAEDLSLLCLQPPTSWKPAHASDFHVVSADSHFHSRLLTVLKTRVCGEFSMILIL